MGFYGNVTNLAKTTMAFDIIYRNKTEMDNAVKNNDDGVFVGRYALIEYDYSGDSTNSSWSSERLPVLYQNENTYYKDTSCLYVYNLYNGLIYRKVVKQNGNWLLSSAIFKYDNGAHTEIDVVSYNDNYNEDKTNYNTTFDSTVWYKTYIGGEPKYVKIGNLNAEVPLIQMSVDTAENHNDDTSAAQNIYASVDSNSTNYLYVLNVERPPTVDVGTLNISAVETSEGALNDQPNTIGYSWSNSPDYKAGYRLDVSLPSLGRADYVRNQLKNLTAPSLVFTSGTNDTKIGTVNGDDWIAVTAPTLEAQTLSFTHNPANTLNNTTTSAITPPATVAFNSTFVYDKISYDTNGHISGITQGQYTLPGFNTTSDNWTNLTINNDGTAAVEHENAQTATQYSGLASDVAPQFNSTFLIPYCGYDEKGHLSSIDSHTVKLPELKITGDTWVDAAVTQAGVFTVSHKAASTVATTAGPSSNQAPGFGDTCNVLYLGYDSKGHIKQSNTSTITLPVALNDRLVLTSYLKNTSANGNLLATDTLYTALSKIENSLSDINGASGLGSLNNYVLKADAIGYNDIYTKTSATADLATKQPKITINGLLKGDGNGNISAATSGIDYQTPIAAGTYQAPIVATGLLKGTGSSIETATLGTDYINGDSTFTYNSTTMSIKALFTKVAELEAAITTP